ncbi:hypothetical protein V2J09_015510 [Rumex salicifolius]
MNDGPYSDWAVQWGPITRCSFLLASAGSQIFFPPKVLFQVYYKSNPGSMNVFKRCTGVFQKSSKLVLTRRELKRVMCTASGDVDMKDLVNYLDNLKNYEKLGVPKNAGIDADDGFDLGRMRRLLDLLGNPQSKYKVVHIAGTKGKGSTAAFLSSILRVEGYSVGCYTSPHIQSIRERMCLGRVGEPVSANVLNSLFGEIKNILDRAIQLEQGHLSHFEVLTGIAFALFAQQNVDIAIIEAGLGGARDATNIISSSSLVASIITTIGREHLDALGGSLESIALAKSGIIKHTCPVVLGGPFLPHVEQIIRDKASSMCSPLVSASDTSNRIIAKGLHKVNGKPCQRCDLVIQIEKDIPLFIELLDINLLMLGHHQLRNAATAVCAALCLQHQGWRISGNSIRSGLESTQLLGRSQFLTHEEAEKLGFPNRTLLLDGAHTKESAEALANTIRMAFPQARLVIVVAMASDKDHMGFARQLLSGQRLEAVFLTEVSIAGGKSRTTPASVLRDSWIRASKELEISIIHDKMPEYQELVNNPTLKLNTKLDKTVLTAESSLTTCLKMGDQILKARHWDESDSY